MLYKGLDWTVYLVGLLCKIVLRLPGRVSQRISLIIQIL